MQSDSTHIVLAGGDKTGYLFPGLAVAEQLVAGAGNWRVTFAGSDRELAARYIRPAGFECMAGPPHPGPIRSVAKSFAAVRAFRRFLRSENVRLVVGLGDSASIPIARAALSLRIPLVLLEQNARPGGASRSLGPSAAAICAGYPEVREHLQTGSPVRVTGNPLRTSFGELLQARPPKPAAKKYLLILAGSQGAHSLNVSVPKALYQLRSALGGWRIIHQAGSGDKSQVVELYGKLGVQARVVSFLLNLPQALAQADLAICRAGGMALAELAVAGLPALIIPQPDATDDHQRANAKIFAGRGCGRSVDEQEPSGQFEGALVGELEQLTSSAQLRHSMSDSLRRHSRPEAAWHVAETIHDVLRTVQRRAA